MEKISWEVVVHTFNSSIQEAEAGQSLNLRPVRAFLEQPGLHREILPLKNRQTNKKKKIKNKIKTRGGK